MGSIIGLVLTANAATVAPLEEAKSQDTKQSQISEIYIVATNSPTNEVRWNYPKLPRMLYREDNGQCVNFARVLSKIDIRGNASEWKDKINAKYPELGALIVFDYGHAGVVVGINYFENEITIVERNYYGLFIVNERKIKMDRTDISGYIKKQKVDNFSKTSK